MTAHTQGRSIVNDGRNTLALERLALEITERLRPCCLHLSEAELVLLATHMATIELKYVGRASTTLREVPPLPVVD
ncbi:MAG: hypothetical protein ABIT20_15730 [Gemmatimonadaceae bacterium]